MRAATLAAAKRGEMELATSRGVVPEGTSRMDPVGQVYGDRVHAHVRDGNLEMAAE